MCGDGCLQEEPIFHLPCQLLALVTEVDKLFTQWRYRHALMVHGMLGVKMGTGGSSGYYYLKASAEVTRACDSRLGRRLPLTCMVHGSLCCCSATKCSRTC